MISFQTTSIDWLKYIPLCNVTNADLQVLIKQVVMIVNNVQDELLMRYIHC